MRNDVAVERPLVICTVIRNDIISAEMTSETSVRDTKIIRSRFLEIERNKTASVRDVSEIAQEKYGEHGQKFSGYNSLSAWPSF